MQKSLVWASIIGVILTFQNCAPSTQAKLGEAAPVPDPVVTYNKTPVTNYSHLALFDGASRPLKYWNLDLATGEAAAVNEAGGNLGSRICLGAAKLQELKQILDSAEVCAPVPSTIAGRMCSMVYSYPYAVLSEASEQVGLGEKADACAGTIDLCGQKAQQLQDYVSGIISNLSAYGCD
jgi:hypothetical protein